MLSIVLWPRGSVEYQMTSEDGLNLAPFKGNLLTRQFMRDECTVHAQELFTDKRGKSLRELFFYKMFLKCLKWPHGKPKLIVWTEKKHPKSSFKVYLKW